jgi:hypothetical protein
MKTMDNNSHSNPYLSVFIGAIFSLSSLISEHMPPPTDWIDAALQLLKVISFGVIGGACGYVGKIWAIKIHKYLKDKSKDVCN